MHLPFMQAESQKTHEPGFTNPFCFLTTHRTTWMLLENQKVMQVNIQEASFNINSVLQVNPKVMFASTEKRLSPTASLSAITVFIGGF